MIDRKPLLAASGEETSIVKPDGKPNRIWLAQGEEKQPRTKIQPLVNVGSSQSSDQIHNDLHVRSPEGQGLAYWPTLPSRSFLLPILKRLLP
jgi:uncharacterized protein YfaP (DUF2135 family)